MQARSPKSLQANSKHVRRQAHTQEAAQRLTPTIPASDRTESPARQASQNSTTQRLQACERKIRKVKFNIPQKLPRRKFCKPEPNNPCKLKRKRFRSTIPTSDHARISSNQLVGHGRSQNQTCMLQGLCASWTPTIPTKDANNLASSQMIEIPQSTAQSFPQANL